MQSLLARAGERELGWAGNCVLMEETGWLFLQSSDQETGTMGFVVKAVGTRDGCGRGHVLRATREEGLLAAVCGKAGEEGGGRQGVVTEAERIVAWTGCQRRHLIPELSGRGMVRTQSALEVKEGRRGQGTSWPGLST